MATTESKKMPSDRCGTENNDARRQKKSMSMLDRRDFLKAGATGAVSMMCGAPLVGAAATPGGDLMTQYSDVIIDAMRDIVKDERANILKAADLLSDNANAGKLLHVYGAGGHSAIAAMEIFWRAGGLACVNGMFPVGTNVMTAGPTTAKVEGFAPYIFSFYDVNPGDTLILVNFYGLNITAVDMALEAKKRGVKLVTINAKKFAKKVPKSFKWRHSSKMDINDLADIAIDNHVPYPDAILKVPGLEEEITPTATILTCFTINCLMSETIRLMVEKGGKPEIWVSNNIPNCDEHNKPIYDKYRHRVHHLYPVW